MGWGGWGRGGGGEWGVMRAKWGVGRLGVGRAGGG